MFIEKAEEVLQDVFGENINIPINLEEICKHNDILLESKDLGDIEIYGRISISPKASYSALIEINNQVHDGYPDTRKRFTLAHELGHYFLHLSNSNNKNASLPADYAISMSRSRSFWNIKESEANKFAACLLMPPSIIKEKMERIAPQLLLETDDKKRWTGTHQTIKNLANEFKVSPKAMTYLLFDFNWLKSETKDRLIDFFNNETENKQ